MKKGYEFEYLKYADEFITLLQQKTDYDKAEEAIKRLKYLYNVKVLYIDDFLKSGRHLDCFTLIDSRYKKRFNHDHFK